MPGEPGAPFAIHANGVAIGPRALLIGGASGAGKSRLSLALIAASTKRVPILLLGDDRILLRRTTDGRLLAQPHPRIAGFIEHRGLGLVACRWRDQAQVAALIQLGPRTPFTAVVFCTIPLLRLGEESEPFDVPRLLAWWRQATVATPAGTSIKISTRESPED